jgi:hypothetical protein
MQKFGAKPPPREGAPPGQFTIDNRSSNGDSEKILDLVTHLAGKLALGHVEKYPEHAAPDHALIIAPAARGYPPDLMTMHGAKVDFERAHNLARGRGRVGCDAKVVSVPYRPVSMDHAHFKTSASVQCNGLPLSERAHPSRAAPTSADATDPARTPILVASCNATDAGKARSPMNRLMVKPMPQRMATP